MLENCTICAIFAFLTSLVCDSQELKQRPLAPEVNTQTAELTRPAELNLPLMAYNIH